MSFQDMTLLPDSYINEDKQLMKVVMILGAAFVGAFFLPWGGPTGAVWTFELFMDIWPLIWGIIIGGLAALTLYKPEFQMGRFGMGSVLVFAGGMGLFVGIVDKQFLVLGTFPFLVTGVLGHLGLLAILVGLYLRGRSPEWFPACVIAGIGGIFLILGLLIPNQMSGDRFPPVALFKAFSGAGVLIALWSLATILAAVGLAAMSALPEKTFSVPRNVREAAGRYGVLGLVAAILASWVLILVLGPEGSGKDIYSWPHRLVVLVGLIACLVLGLELMVRAFKSTDAGRFTLMIINGKPIPQPSDPNAGRAAAPDVPPPPPGAAPPPPGAPPPPPGAAPPPPGAAPPPQGIVPPAAGQGFAQPAQAPAVQQQYAAPSPVPAPAPQPHVAVPQQIPQAAPHQQPYAAPSAQAPQPQPYQQPQAAPAAVQAAPQASAAQASQPQAGQAVHTAPCPYCNGTARWIEQYQRWWCDACQKYL